MNNPVDRERVVKLLRESELNFEQIGKRMGCSGALISTINDEFEVRPDPVKPDTEKMIELLRTTQLNCAEIARQCGTTAGTVSKLNKKLSLRVMPSAVNHAWNGGKPKR